MLNEDVVIKCLKVHDKGFQILCKNLLTELTVHPSSPIFCLEMWLGFLDGEFS